METEQNTIASLIETSFHRPSWTPYNNL